MRSSRCFVIVIRMNLWHVLALALLQGLTEFLPISSSAHLILLPNLVGWQDQGLAFDIAVHVGTLSAVTVYFRHELWTMSREWTVSLAGGSRTPQSRLAWAVLFGTVPVGIAGLSFNHSVEQYLRSPLIIAAASIGFGLLLWWADFGGTHRRDEHELTWRDVAMIRVAQAVALIPGTSRSGITMTAGLAMGLNRSASARFSFLLSVPVIVLAGGLELVELVVQAGPVDWRALIIGAAVSGVSAYLCIEFFLKLIERIGMFPFVLYRVLLGIVLIVLFAR